MWEEHWSWMYINSSMCCTFETFFRSEIIGQFSRVARRGLIQLACCESAMRPCSRPRWMALAVLAHHTIHLRFLPAPSLWGGAGGAIKASPAHADCKMRTVTFHRVLVSRLPTAQSRSEAFTMMLELICNHQDAVGKVGKAKATEWPQSEGAQ